AQPDRAGGDGGGRAAGVRERAGAAPAAPPVEAGRPIRHPAGQPQPRGEGAMRHSTRVRRAGGGAIAVLTLLGCAHAAPLSDLPRVLDDFHDAAARADEERYFAHFAPEGVFVGTDAGERWDLKAFREYAHPHFAKGKAWTFRGAR